MASIDGENELREHARRKPFGSGGVIVCLESTKDSVHVTGEGNAVGRDLPGGCAQFEVDARFRFEVVEDCPCGKTDGVWIVCKAVYESTEQREEPGRPQSATGPPWEAHGTHPMTYASMSTGAPSAGSRYVAKSSLPGI